MSEELLENSLFISNPILIVASDVSKPWVSASRVTTWIRLRTECERAERQALNELNLSVLRQLCGTDEVSSSDTIKPKAVNTGN